VVVVLEVVGCAGGCGVLLELMLGGGDDEVAVLVLE
jgi:hypothetical protein